MRTRTLLLLAIGCGLLILLAGGVQLLRISNQDAPEAPHAVGETAQLGDAVVTVDEVDIAADLIVVTVSLSGVDDPDGLDGFTLIAPGKAMLPSSDSPPGDTSVLPRCVGFTVEPVQCLLYFGATDLEGTDRQLLFQRAAEQVRWRLA